MTVSNRLLSSLSAHSMSADFSPTSPATSSQSPADSGQSSSMNFLFSGNATCRSLTASSLPGAEEEANLLIAATINDRASSRGVVLRQATPQRSGTARRPAPRSSPWCRQPCQRASTSQGARPTAGSPVIERDGLVPGPRQRRCLVHAPDPARGRLAHDQEHELTPARPFVGQPDTVGELMRHDAAGSFAVDGDPEALGPHA